MKVGYVRISTAAQNTDRQEILMEQLGVEKVYIDKVSGKDSNRPQLKAMISYVRDGDTVVVESISRFARNTADFLALMGQLSDKGVKFVSQKESIDTESVTGRFMLTIFAAVAELERESMLLRQREGIDAARAKGVHCGRKRKVPLKKFIKEYTAVAEGKLTKAACARLLGISDQSFRNYEAEMRAMEKAADSFRDYEAGMRAQKKATA